MKRIKTLLPIFLIAASTVHGDGLVEYTLDPGHTHVIWKVERFGFSNTYGSFARVEGQLSHDPTDPEASRVHASIRVGSLRSDLEQREQVVLGNYWLSASEFPTIEFVSEQVTVEMSEDCAATCFVVDGQMTLRGVTAPLRLHVVLNKQGTDPVSRRPALGFSASGSFDRKAFGIETALELIGNTVSFQVETLALAGE